MKVADLYGKWNFQFIIQRFYFKINPNGTFESDFFDGGDYHTGHYQFFGNMIIFNHSDGERSYPYTIKSLDSLSGKMIVTALDGTEMYFTKAENEQA